MRFFSRKLASRDLDEDEQLIVTIQPGEQLIVQCERRLPADVMRRLKAQLDTQLHADVKVIVLEAGLKLVGVRKINTEVPNEPQEH